MRVWIDQDLCTGDGLCVEVCPALFAMHDDGLAYVKERDWPSHLGPDGTASEPVLQMSAGTAAVPDDLVEATVEAAEECPGECIFIDVGCPSRWRRARSGPPERGLTGREETPPARRVGPLPGFAGA